MDDSPGEISVDEKWFRVGVFLAIAQITFLLVVLALLQVNLYLGLAVAVLGSTAGAIGIMLYVFYIK